MNSKLIHRRGLTLLEIVLAMVVLTVAAAVTMTYIRQPSDRVKRETCNLRIQQLEVLALQFQADYGSLPSRDLRQLTDQRYYGEKIPVCPFDGRPYELDRSNGKIFSHNHP